MVAQITAAVTRVAGKRLAAAPGARPPEEASAPWQLGRPLPGLGRYLKFCAAQILPVGVVAKPQAARVYFVLDMLM
jgi:hypothetical protein